MRRKEYSTLKLSLILLVLVFGPILSGCQWYRKTMLQGVEEYAMNVEAEMRATEKLLSVWLYRSEQLRKAMGARFGALPGDATEAWKALDQVCLELGYDVVPPMSLWPEKGEEPPTITMKIHAGEAEITYEAEGLSQRKLGGASGTWCLIAYETVRQAVKELAPDLIGMLPSFL
jgi:hypothetical protein